jgi:hypothetical protein
MASLRPSLFVRMAADSDFAICYLDGATRIFKKRSIPPLRLHAPGSNEDAVSHDHNPDADETVLAGASANETFALPEGIQGVIGELMLRSDMCTRLADQLLQSVACPFSFLCTSLTSAT